MTHAPILEFDGAACPDGAGAGTMTARFLPGVLSVVRVEPGLRPAPLADMAVGLVEPARGRVLFLGEAWQAAGPEQNLARRARIGRVFWEQGWISNLNVLENVTLPQRHHTRRPVPEIIAEAEALARRFGLERLPAARPARVDPRDLRRAEWVRAFLGNPALVLLEEPLRGAGPEAAPRLFEAVREACARQAAVLWLAERGRIDSPPDVPAAAYVLRGPSLEPAGTPAPVSPTP